MRKTIVSFIGLLLLLCACNSSPRKTNREELSVKRDSDSLKVQSIVLPDDSGLVYLDLRRGRIKERIRKSPEQTVFVEFTSHDSTKVSAWLSSDDSLANVRFSQIIMPDGSADGPFGSEINYDLTQKGTYRISIHENMMAGDPWGGVFILRLQLHN